MAVHVDEIHTDVAPGARREAGRSAGSRHRAAPGQTDRWRDARGRRGVARRPSDRSEVPRWRAAEGFDD